MTGSMKLTLKCLLVVCNPKGRMTHLHDDIWEDLLDHL